jgi:hypothetical protein
MRQTIYVRLLEENVDVWRPVEAEPQADGAFLLPAHAPPDEVWEFPPGSLVECEGRSGNFTASKLV